MSTSPPSTPRPRRRWLQFSLRTLLIVMLLAGGGMGWFAYKLQQARRQRDAVAAIRNLGGTPAHMTDAELILLQRFPQLEWLKLNGTQVTGIGLEHLQGLLQLHPRHGCQIALVRITHQPGTRWRRHVEREAPTDRPRPLRRSRRHPRSP